MTLFIDSIALGEERAVAPKYYSQTIGKGKIGLAREAQLAKEWAEKRASKVKEYIAKLKD